MERETGKSEKLIEKLEQLPAELEDALLAYLNLPPVGCLADQLSVPGSSSKRAFEIQSPLRSALKKRRDSSGGRFKNPRDLIGIEQFGQVELDEIVTRLGDLTRYGHRARPVWGGPESKREFFKLLEGAKRYIHISTYIIGGTVGLELAELLARKVRAGVEVRVLFCASGFVISGSPSGNGFVSRLSGLRSHLLNDMYVRKRIIAQFEQNGVPFVNSAPIGRHWRRRDFRSRGVRNDRAYYTWARDKGIPDDWLEEQERIDRECSLGFANVDHRKMVIVDGETAFVGSQNIADSYFYDNELSPDPRVNVKNWQWHDNSTIIEGGIVRSMNRIFASRWALCGGDFFNSEDSYYSPPLKRCGPAAVSMQVTRPGMMRLPLGSNWKGFLKSFFGADARPICDGENPIRDRLLALPAFATSELLVEHCYPADADLLIKWARAAKNKLEMVVPLFYDTRVLGAECDRFFPELMNDNVQLHGYHRAIIHSKILVMDGFYVATGSYNLTLRSARADLENEFFIQCSEYGETVRDLIQGDFSECHEVSPSALDRFRSRRSLPVFDAVVRYFIL